MGATTTRFQDLLDDDELDAVVIATPVYTHVELCTRSLAAGKHTFVEKPLATSAALAGELVDLAALHGRALMCGHTFIYSPAVRAVRLMLDAGALGDVYFISSSRVNLGLHQRDISVVWDLGPHDFSILLHWLGAPPVRRARDGARLDRAAASPTSRSSTLTFASAASSPTSS